MPLRDHFRPPLDLRHHWEGFHGGWPTMIVASLSEILPRRYIAEPRVRLGVRGNEKWLLESWLYTLAIGEPLPTLPLWLSDDLAVPLELEASCEETCRILRIA
jgi:hypothetical protein